MKGKKILNKPKKEGRRGIRSALASQNTEVNDFYCVSLYLTYSKQVALKASQIIWKETKGNNSSNGKGNRVKPFALKENCEVSLKSMAL